MPTITVRNVPERTVAKLKARAARRGTSMEAEARAALDDLPEEEDRAAVVERARKFLKDTYGDRVFPDSVELFREIREEDPLTSADDAYRFDDR